MVLERILKICSQDNFAYVGDFAWYLKVLVNLTRVRGSTASNAGLLSSQLMEVIIRVAGVRKFGVSLMTQLLLKGDLLENAHNEMSNVLFAAAWIIGEYCQYMPLGVHALVLRALLSRDAHHLSESTQAVFMQSAVKVFISASSRDFEGGGEGKSAAQEEDSDSDSDDDAEHLQEFTKEGPLDFKMWCQDMKEMLDELTS